MTDRQYVFGGGIAGVGAKAYSAPQDAQRMADAWAQAQFNADLAAANQDMQYARMADDIARAQFSAARSLEQDALNRRLQEQSRTDRLGDVRFNRQLALSQEAREAERQKLARERFETDKALTQKQLDLDTKFEQQEGNALATRYVDTVQRLRPLAEQLEGLADTENMLRDQALAAELAFDERSKSFAPPRPAPGVLPDQEKLSKQVRLAQELTRDLNRVLKLQEEAKRSRERVLRDQDRVRVDAGRYGAALTERGVEGRGMVFPFPQAAALADATQASTAIAEYDPATNSMRVRGALVQPGTSSATTPRTSVNPFEDEDNYFNALPGVGASAPVATPAPRTSVNPFEDEDNYFNALPGVGASAPVATPAISPLPPIVDGRATFSVPPQAPDGSLLSRIGRAVNKVSAIGRPLTNPFKDEDNYFGGLPTRLPLKSPQLRGVSLPPEPGPAPSPSRQGYTAERRAQDRVTALSAEIQENIDRLAAAQSGRRGGWMSPEMQRELYSDAVKKVQELNQLNPAAAERYLASPQLREPSFPEPRPAPGPSRQGYTAERQARDREAALSKKIQEALDQLAAAQSGRRGSWMSPDLQRELYSDTLKKVQELNQLNPAAAQPFLQ